MDITISMDLSQLALAVATVVGVIISVTVANRNVKKDMRTRIAALREDIRLRREEMHLMVGRAVLPRNLEALQSCFQYTMEINRILYRGMSGGPSDSLLSERLPQNLTTLQAKLDSLRDWYEQHCFYLPKDVRADFLQLLTYAYQHIDSTTADPVKESRAVWDTLTELTRGLEQKMDSFMTKYSLFGDNEK